MHKKYCSNCQMTLQKCAAMYNHLSTLALLSSRPSRHSLGYPNSINSFVLLVSHIAMNPPPPSLSLLDVVWRLGSRIVERGRKRNLKKGKKNKASSFSLIPPPIPLLILEKFREEEVDALHSSSCPAYFPIVGQIAQHVDIGTSIINLDC